MRDGAGVAFVWLKATPCGAALGAGDVWACRAGVGGERYFKAAARGRVGPARACFEAATRGNLCKGARRLQARRGRRRRVDDGSPMQGMAPSPLFSFFSLDGGEPMAAGRWARMRRGCAGGEGASFGRLVRSP